MSIIKERKVVLIGAGAVGTSFLYAAMSRSIAQRFEIIDINEGVVDGNVLDFQDVIATTDKPFKVAKGSYPKCKDADLIVITAGRPQRDGETRLDMVADNAKIMKHIALGVKKSGFNGITIIASNPVDIMTQVYQEVTGYPYEKVIGSGTSLDTARLKFELGKRLDISPSVIQAYVMGEHGDSSVSVFSSATVGSKTVTHLVEEKQLDAAEFPKIHETVWKKAYEIIKLKRATFYGIGSSLANLASMVFNNERQINAVGAFLQGEYGQKGIYVGVPCIIGAKGIIRIVEIEMNEAEKKKFDDSCIQLKKSLKVAQAAIK